jgi:hypothetical protein
MIDNDYVKNKITVCCHLGNIYNTFNVRKGRPTMSQSNYFDTTEWLAREQVKRDMKNIDKQNNKNKRASSKINKTPA